MKTSIPTTIFYFLFFLIPGAVLAQETVFPAGHNIDAAYSLSAFDLSVDDTLLITRSIANHESFSLPNLYMADNLPPQFSIISYSLEIDGVPASHSYTGSLGGEVIPSCDSYRWIIDEPSPSDTSNRPLLPNETLTLEYAVVCAVIGSYTLPYHTFCAYGDTSGIFSTADSLFVTFSPGSSADDRNQPVPPRPLVTLAYPNPFNNDLLIAVRGMAPGTWPVNLAIYDLTGAMIYQGAPVFSGDNGRIRWSPGKNVAAGVYFYRLISGSFESSGKITFLK